MVKTCQQDLMHSCLCWPAAAAGQKEKQDKGIISLVSINTMKKFCIGNIQGWSLVWITYHPLCAEAPLVWLCVLKIHSSQLDYILGLCTLSRTLNFGGFNKWSESLGILEKVRKLKIQASLENCNFKKRRNLPFSSCVDFLPKTTSRTFKLRWWRREGERMWEQSRCLCGEKQLQNVRGVKHTKRLDIHKNPCLVVIIIKKINLFKYEYYKSAFSQG